MKNLITYLKALWRRVADSQRKKIGVTLGEATIEHPFSTYSAPFGTCWQPSGKLHSVVRCAAMLVMLFTIGSGNVWGADYSKNDSWNFSTSGNANWTCTGGGSYCGGYGKKGSAFSVSKYGISDFEGVNFSNHENVSLTIYVKAGTNSGTNSYTVKLLDSSGNVISGDAYTKTKTGGMGKGTNASSASESSLTFTPTVAFSGYKIEFQAKGFITQTRYVLTYDDKAGGCEDPDTDLEISASATTIYTSGTSTLSTTGGNGSTVTYSVTSDNDDYASIVGTTFSATRAGTYTIQASQEEDGGVCGGTDDIEITVRYQVKWSVNGNDAYTTGSPTTYIGTHDTKVTTLPTTPASGLCDGSKVFVGWTKTPIVGTTNTVPSDLFTTVAGSPSIIANTTFYAVFATSATATFTASDITNTPATGNTREWGHTASGTLLYLSAGQYYTGGTPYTWTVTQGTSNYARFTAGTNKTITQIVVTISGTNYKINSVTKGSLSTSSTTQTITGINSSTVDCKATSSYQIRITQAVVTYVSAFATSCCTPLGTINGSVSLSQLASPDPTKLKATWTMNASTGISSYNLEVYNSSDVLVKTINGYTSGSEITGLTPCTTYYVKLYTVSSGGEYCDGGLISTSSTVTTNGYTLNVSKTNVSLSSGSEPSNICSDVSATYSASVGYVLPSTITVTNAGAQNTGWTWNSSTGVLTINKASVTGNVTVTITGVEQGCSGQYTLAYGATAQNDDPYITSPTKECFSQVGETTEYQITGFTIPNTNTYYWVGYNGYFYNDGLGSSNAHSSRNQFKYMPVANLQGSSCGGTGEYYKHAAAGAYGTLRIYSNYSDNNLYVGFSPAGYQMRVGSGESWSNIQLTRVSSTSVWKSDVMDMSAALIAKNYYINVWTSGSYSSGDAGVAINNWTDGSSTISSMQRKTNSGESYASGVTASMRGFFRVWTDNCANNGYAHFVPVHRVIYDANWPSGVEPAATYSSDVSVEENGNITVPAAPSAPTGYHFVEWNTAENGSGTGYAPGDTYTISAGASADVTLYAKWSNTTAITLSKGSQGTANGSAVGTYGSNTVGSFTAVTYGGTTYRLKGYSKSGTPSEIVIDAEGHFVANTTYTDASGNWKSTEAAVTLVAQWQAGYTIKWMANGEVTPFATTFVDAGNTLVLPGSTPTSCDDGDTDTYTTFIGWYSTAAGTNSSPTANIASCGTKATAGSAVSSGATYYAVWGNGGLSADDVKQVTLDFTSNTNWGFPTDYTTTTNSYTSGDYTVTLTYGTAGDGWKYMTDKLLYGKTGCYLQLPAFSFTTSKIIATGPASGASGSVTWNVFVGSSSVSTEVTGSNGAKTFAISSGNQAAGTIYKIKATNSNNIQIKTIDVYSPGVAATGFISSCCASSAVVTVAPDEDELELDIDGEATTSVSVSQSGGGAGRYYPPTVTPAATGSTDWAGEYKTSAYSVNFIATAAGTYTVKAPFRETSYGCDKTGSATITVAANPILTPSSDNVAIDATCGMASSATDITVNSRYLASTSITASVVTSTGTGSFKISSDNSSFDTSNKTITGGTSSKATSHIYVRYDATEGQTGSATGTLTLTCGEKVVNIPLSATVTCSAHVVLSSEAPIQITAANGIWVEAANTVTVAGSYLTTNADNANVSIRAYTNNAHFQIKAGGTTGEGTAKTSQGSSLSLVTNHSTATWNGSIGVVYKPAAHNTTESATLTVEVYRANGSNVYDTKTYTLEGRSLPENFVIAVTDGSGNWYAVPADMVAPWGGSCSSGLSTYKPYPIEVDNTTTPTAISGNTPSRAVYTAAARTGNLTTNPQTLSFKSVALSGSGNYYLYGSSTNVDSDGSNTSIQNANFTSSEKEKWFLDVVNWTNKEYNMHVATSLNTNVLAFTTAGGARNVGQYAPNASTTKKAVYILPATSTCDNYNAPENITCYGIDATNYTIRFKPDRTKNYEVSLDGSSWSNVTTRVINNCTDDSQPTLVEADIPLATYRGQEVHIRVKAAGSCAESTTFDVPDPSLTVNAGTWMSMTGVAGYAFSNSSNSITISGLASCANTVSVSSSNSAIGASIDQETGVVTLTMTSGNATVGTHNATLTFTAGGAITRTQGIRIEIYAYAPITISSPQITTVNGVNYYCVNSAPDAGTLTVGSALTPMYRYQNEILVALTSSNWSGYFHNYLIDVTEGDSVLLTCNTTTLTDYHYVVLNLAKSKCNEIGHTYRLYFNTGRGTSGNVLYNSSGVPYAPSVFEFTTVDCSVPTALAACPVTTTTFTANWMDLTCAATNSTISVMQAGDPVANVALGNHTLSVEGTTLTGANLITSSVYQDWGFASSTGYYDKWLVSDQAYKNSTWSKATPSPTANGIRLEKANGKAFVFTPRMNQLYPSVTTLTKFKVTVKVYNYSGTHSIMCIATTTEPNWDTSPTSGNTATWNGVSGSKWESASFVGSSGLYKTFTFTVSGLTAATRLGFGCGCYSSSAGFALSAVKIEPITEVKSVTAPCSGGSAEITGLTAGESYFYTVTNNGNTSNEMMVDTRTAAPSITYFPSKVNLQADVNGSVSQVVTFSGKNFTQCDVDAIITASTKTGSSYFTVTPGDYTYIVGTGAISGSFTVTYNPTSAGEHTGTYCVGGVGTPIDLDGHACPAGFGTMATGAVGATGEHSATVGWSLSTTGTVMLAQGTRINTELLSNGGFELGLAGWDEDKNMTGDVATAVKRTGDKSRYCTTSNASIYVNGRSGFCGVYSEEMTFLPGTYSAEAYVRHAASSTTTSAFNAADNEFYIGVCKDTVVKNNNYVKFTSVKANEDYSCQFNSEADAWKKVDVTFTLTEKLTGRLFIARKTSTVAYFFLDDVSLKMTAGGTLNDKTMFVEGASVTSATSVELTGLKPQTTYSYYVLGDDGCESNIATFTTQASEDPIAITATPSPVTIAGPLGKTVSTTMVVSTVNAYANVIVAAGTCTDGRISVSPSSLPADGGVVTVSFTPLNTDEMGDNGSCALQLSTTGAVSPTNVPINWAVTSGFDPSTPVVEVVDISNTGMNVEHNVQTTGEATVSIIINRETTEEEREENVGDELFFSKYYEANQNVKLIAIFNPTNDVISLAGTYIWLSRDASNYWGHNDDNRLSLAPYGKTPGQIGPMEEIIFYRYESNVSNDRQTIECAAGKADMSEWNRVYGGVLSFSGNDALLLVRDTTINNRIPPATSKNGDDLTWRYLAEYDVNNKIVKSTKKFAMLDIIGARTEENAPSNTNLVSSWSWTNCKDANKVENGDDAGWIGYGKDLKEQGAAYYNCGADPLKHGYLLSTNRCLLIRLKTVKNGSNAIQNNEDDFTTLATEWQGAHVPLDREHEWEVGCENFSFVGGYDYAGYYNKWTPLGEDEVLPGVPQPDGSYYIEIVNGTPHYYCKNLYIQVAEKTTVNGVDVENVHVSEVYKVPIVVESSTTTADASVFRNADDVDPVNTLTETICNTCDVVVRNKATLTNHSAGQHKFHGIELYAGSKLDLNGQNMELKTISMDSKNDTVSYAIINKGGTITIDSVVHVKRINDAYWYPFSLPYDCKINTIRQLNGKSMGKYEDGNNMVDSDWGIKYYDGKARQQSNSFVGVGNKSPHWKYMPANGTLKANVGYIIGLFTTEWTGQHKTVYFPPESGSEYEESNESGAYKEAAVSNWNVTLDGDKQNHGWNFVGSPYISIFDPTAAAANQQGVNNATVMIGGKVGVPDYTDESNVYVSVPDGAASRTYTQKAAASTKLEPFRGYFVQVKDPTNGQDNDDIAIRYSKNGRTLNLAPSKERKASQIIEFEVLFGTDEKNDNAGITVDGKHDSSYELGYDLIKMYTKANKPQIYSQTGGYDLAYNALSADDVNYIPLVMYAPKAGTYTVKLDEFSKTSGAEAIYLLYNGEEVTDLLFNSYDIEVPGAKEISGYAIRVVPRKEVPTDIDIVPVDGSDWNSSTPKKFIYKDQLYILRGGNIYDATGKQVREIK